MAMSVAALRTFHYSMHTSSPSHSAAGKPGVVSMHNAKYLTSTKSYVGRELVSSPRKQTGILMSCVKTSDAAVTNKSDGSPERVTSRGATFPSGFEELILGVCDNTEIAELKIKIGDFEMHMKRNIKSAEAPNVSIASPTEAPPIPSKPMIDSAPFSSEKPKENPLKNETVKRSRKLAALEASGATGYALISSPKVGLFRIARTLKGKKQPPICKKGSVIKEEQIVCYLDQFGTQLPVKVRTEKRSFHPLLLITSEFRPIYYMLSQISLVEFLAIMDWVKWVQTGHKLSQVFSNVYNCNHFIEKKTKVIVII